MTVDVKRVLAFVGHSVDVLETIGKVADNLIGRNTTLEEVLAVLAGISALSKSVASGIQNTQVSTADIQRDIDQLRGMIADNNAAVDASVDARFPKG